MKPGSNKEKIATLINWTLKKKLVLILIQQPTGSNSFNSYGRELLLLIHKELLEINKK